MKELREKENKFKNASTISIKVVSIVLNNEENYIQSTILAWLAKWENSFIDIKPMNETLRRLL